MFGFYSHKELTIYAPVAGKVIDITEVSDPVFAQKVMGDGVAIEPEENQIVAPFDGTVRMLAETRHAIALSKRDFEVLIHVGLDTVALNGEGFTSHVAIGDFVKKGTVLLSFDSKYIKEKGKSLITPVVIMNTPEKMMDIKKYFDDDEKKIMDLKLKE